eukprot:3915439-Rhodomonas_salina.6
MTFSQACLGFIHLGMALGFAAPTEANFLLWTVTLRRTENEMVLALFFLCTAISMLCSLGGSQETKRHVVFPNLLFHLFRGDVLGLIWAVLAMFPGK